MRKGKPLLLLLMIFGLLSGQGAVAATQFRLQGQIYKTTCTIQTPGDGTSIVLEDVTTEALIASTTLVSAKEFTINISCSTPSYLHEVTGKFTTSGKVDSSVKALKNTITDATGAKDVGLQIKDKTTDTIVDFSATQKFTLTFSSENSASFRFEIGYMNLGVPEKGDVHAAATFTLIYA
ncbi:fimbrial protein [Citrobacter freundii]|uniref:fimbrial protein n=1 Tax=Citrobacter freundii TaxID=546 RepID=UPI00190101C9|nr:fimbrial protein [Citrobacter freundii]MBJ9179757.1 type 1 fimbrial protein [Citrobacter freundii]